MATTSQQPRGTGLSSSLISDFRTIVSSLEQEKAGREDGDSGGEASVAARPSTGELRSLGDVRSRLAALGDMGDVLAARPAAARVEPAAKSKADSAQSARRRSFGSAARPSGETETRRKRNASKDVITWQRLGVLAVFMAVVGGGAVALQSLAAREEAKVAPEVIGNAAVASVAPSAQPADQQPVALKPVELSGAAIEASVPAPAAPSVLAHGTAADSLPPILLNASGRGGAAADAAAATPGVTAFAAADPVVPAAAISDTAEDASAPVETVAEDASEPVPARVAALPKQAPLPPTRAPVRDAAVVSPAATAPEAASAATVPAEAEPLPPGFGGDPVGTAVTRRAVTMRAAPKKGAAAIGNLPGGKQVQLVTCQQWCEIVVDGKRAFVYKSFVDTGAVAAAPGGGADESGDTAEGEAAAPE